MLNLYDSSFYFLYDSTSIRIKDTKYKRTFSKKNENENEIENFTNEI